MTTTQTENQMVEMSLQAFLNTFRRIVFPGGTPDGPSDPPPNQHQDLHPDPHPQAPFPNKWSSLKQETWDAWVWLTSSLPPPPPQTSVPMQTPTPDSELLYLPASSRIFLSSLRARYPALWETLGGSFYTAHTAAINPQPLPPRLAFLVAFSHAVISRATLVQDTAAAVLRSSGQREIIVIGGYATDVADDLCPPPNRFNFPWPFPRPRPDWLNELLDGGDLLVLGTQFADAAKQTSVPELRRDFLAASAKFAQAGISRLQ